MASKRKAAKAGAAGAAATAQPYITRLIQDEELRENLRTAFEAGRGAANRLSNGKAPAKALMDDKKLHKDLKAAADALRDSADALREGPKKKKRKGGIGKLLFLGIVGGIAGVALNEGLRSKVMDLLFGAEEEFDYTSTTVPATPAPDASQPVGT